MDVVKIQQDDQLARFFEAHCPVGLRVCAHGGCGYAEWFTLKIRSGKWWKMDDIIARFDDNTIELLEPQYLEDVKDVVSKYESLGGGKVTIRYWGGLK
jgi:hypothetical protein